MRSAAITSAKHFPPRGYLEANYVRFLVRHGDLLWIAFGRDEQVTILVQFKDRPWTQSH